MTQYRERLILYIDILGFKDFIDKSNNDNQNYNRFIEFNESITKALNIYPSIDIEINQKLITLEYSSITQFSDSIIISINILIVEQFEQLVLDVVNIICTGFHYGFIFRGAITFGDIIHDSKNMFGPGFIRAYNIENKLAVFPRVVIDKRVYELPSLKMHTKILDKIVQEDFDGVKYIEPFIGLHYKYSDEKIRQALIADVEKILEENTKHDDYTMQKYRWLENKLKQYKQEHPTTGSSRFGARK